jgi:hypothetical protein
MCAAKVGAMKKTFLRIQGFNGGCEPVMAIMQQMREASIPFIIANDHIHSGSRRLLREWPVGSDLLYALVRQSDVPLIKLINTKCRIVEDPDFNWWKTVRLPDGRYIPAWALTIPQLFARYNS